MSPNNANAQEIRLKRVLEIASGLREAFGPEGLPDIDAELYDPVTGLPR